MKLWHSGHKTDEKTPDKYIEEWKSGNRRQVQCND